MPETLSEWHLLRTTPWGQMRSNLLPPKNQKKERKKDSTLLSRFTRSLTHSASRTAKTFPLALEAEAEAAADDDINHEEGEMMWRQFFFLALLLASVRNCPDVRKHGKDRLRKFYFFRGGGVSFHCESIPFIPWHREDKRNTNFQNSALTDRDMRNLIFALPVSKRRFGASRIRFTADGGCVTSCEMARNNFTLLTFSADA